jgi:hypothetical protein
VPFVPELPENAVNVILGAVQGEDHTPGTFALATYDILGYVLFEIFGDQRYMIAATPQSIALKNEFFTVFTPDDIKDIIKNGKLYLQIATEALSMYQAGTAPLLIATKLVFKFGPQVLPLIRKVFDLVERFKHV